MCGPAARGTLCCQWSGRSCGETVQDCVLLVPVGMVRDEVPARDLPFALGEPIEAECRESGWMPWTSILRLIDCESLSQSTSQH